MNSFIFKRIIQRNIVPNNAYLYIRLNSTSLHFQSNETDYELGDFSNDVAKYLKRNSKVKKIKTIPQHTSEEEPVIKCKNAKLNHYRNMQFDNLESIPLASKGWFHYKSKGDYFTINIYNENYVPQSRRKAGTFEELNLNPKIIEILKKEQIKTPSEIQSSAIPSILAGYNTLIAAETGCGKTLAFLVPIIQRILEYKDKIQKDINSPFAVIISPSRELSQQLYKVTNMFDELHIRSRLLVGGHIKQRIVNPLFEEVHILVATIGVLNRLINADIYSLKQVRHVVLDEADSLLDDSFNSLLRETLKMIPFRNESCNEETSNFSAQLILSSATMPTSLQDILENFVDVEKMNKIKTQRLHYVMPHVKQRFWRVGKSDKPVHLLRLLKKTYTQKKPTLIFCNKSSVCHWVVEFLNDNKIESYSFSAETSLEDRKNIFSRFQAGQIHILVCTDIASRGLDTKRAEHIINYDFPLFMSDYIHRCGRTGRLSSRANGVVTSLISAKNEIDLVQKIEIAARTMDELPNVNANIKRIMTYKWQPGKSAVHQSKPLEMFI